MDLESMFSPSSYASETKETTVTVHQADVALRMGFIRKVYGILTAQLLLSMVICVVLRFVPSVEQFVQTNVALTIAVVVISLLTLVALIIFRHQSPTNLYLLAIFTVCESLSLGTVLTYYDQAVIIKAFVLTTAVFIGLTAYAMQSKHDFSTWGAALFTFLFVLIIAGIMQIFFFSEAAEFVISVGGALVFCGFILFDTHVLMHKLSPEEYILASINLYLDFINLFIYILRILQAMKNK